MKVKDALIKSINQPENEEVSYEELQDIGPFAFTWFTMDLAAVYMCAITTLLSKDMVEVTFGKNKAGGKGSPIEKIKCIDALNVLAGGDLLRHSSIFQQALGFLKWYLEQDIPEGEEDEAEEAQSWNDACYMEKKWNEYAKTMTEREKK